MNGTMVNVDKYSRGYFFIDGEDGRTYFAARAYLVEDDHVRVWNDYVWSGNTVEFDVKEELPSPRAINIRPTREFDPKIVSKREAAIKRLNEMEEARKREDEAILKAHEDKIKRQQKQKGREMWKEYRDDHDAYCIQRLEEGYWRLYMPRNYKTANIRVAKSMLKRVQKIEPESRFRVKHICIYNLGSTTVYRDYKTNVQLT